MTPIEFTKQLISELGKDPDTDELVKAAIYAVLDQMDQPKAKPEPKKVAPKKTGGRKPVDTGKIRALHNAGWPVAKIADEMRVSEQTVRNKLKGGKE